MLKSPTQVFSCEICKCDIESNKYLNPKIWETIPSHIETSTILEFKQVMQSIHSTCWVYLRHICLTQFRSQLMLYSEYENVRDPYYLKNVVYTTNLAF